MLYGSSRLGLWERNKKLTFTPVTETIQSVYRGDKRYELSDHLGNVHVVLTDRKELHCGLEDNVPFPEYYTAEVKNRYDYYPFGMLMEERKYSGPNCTYDRDTLFTLVFADYFSAPVADWYYLDGFFNPTVSGGYMHLDQSDNTLFKLITPTANGKQYRVRFGVDMNGCDSARVAGNVQGLTTQTFTNSGDHIFYFSSNDSMYSGVSFYVDAPCDVLIDYVIVEEMDISSTVVCDSNAALAYRYGFNSKWKDDEVYGIEGTAYDFGARLYDSRIAKFLSVDPLSSDYSWNSPYSYAANNPIYYIDKNGENPFPFIVLRILAAMTNRVTYMQGGLDARSGIALTSAGGAVGWGVAADPHGNFAFYGTIGAFYDWFGNGETLSGAKSGHEKGDFYFGLDLSATFNIGISGFSNVTDLSGLMKNMYGDIGAFEFAEQFDKSGNLKGLDAGGGAGVGGGMGSMTSQTYLFAFTLDDLIDISQKALNFTAKYAYEKAVNKEYKDVSLSIDYKVENRILTVTGQITGKDSEGNNTVIGEYPIAKFKIKEYHLETENVKSASK